MTRHLHAVPEPEPSLWVRYTVLVRTYAHDDPADERHPAQRQTVWCRAYGRDKDTHRRDEAQALADAITAAAPPQVIGGRCVHTQAVVTTAALAGDARRLPVLPRTS